MSYLSGTGHIEGKLGSIHMSPVTKTLSDVFPENVADAAGIGFITANLPKSTTPVLWVQDHLSRKETGHPYLPGLPERQMLYLRLSRPVDVLRVMEEGLGYKGVCAVIGEIWGDPQALDFTATKRLALRSEKSGIACWLVRHAASPDLSAARNRWRVSSLPSAADLHDPQGPGDPRWQVELFRSRLQKPGTWLVQYDRAQDRLDFAPAFRDGEMVARDGEAQRRAAG